MIEERDRTPPETPVLSVIVPMRGGVPQTWLDSLLSLRGSVEFVLVYPPGVAHFPSRDPRLKQLVSPVQGELFQRFTALLNASGTHVLSINCDEHIHPDLPQLTQQYFDRFPDCDCFALSREACDYGDASLHRPWHDLGDVRTWDVYDRPHGNDTSQLRVMPIAPLNNSFRWSSVFQGRRDQNGWHRENFDKKVWKTRLVHQTIEGLVPLFKLWGPFKFIPFWTADRLLGLAVQAESFQGDRILGHHLPYPPQLRIEENPPDETFQGKARPNRRYVLAELILLRRYPQYGYFWNLVFSKNHGLQTIWFPRDWLRTWRNKLRPASPTVSSNPSNPSKS